MNVKICDYFHLINSISVIYILICNCSKILKTIEKNTFQCVLFYFFLYQFVIHFPAAVRFFEDHFPVLLQPDFINAELSALFDRLHAI